ncbi:hypothetical protein KPL71_023506 [Citrus sinensis]|uniref:Uncharacterized protein n=1 Tax=Citrus sinensis TaxID=2711 RepID=A0ACB8IJH8_CITSI|nr:hypothetical protein KPL71_023506 [Citrus sinensis]
MEIGMSGKLHHLEETLNKLTETIMASKGALSHSIHDQIDSSRLNREKNEEELWARFGLTEYEDFDEALSRVRQTGSLHDYQKEFERLGNRVHGWTQKALVGTFMGGLKPEISEEIHMFISRTLKEAISLACMKDDQLSRQEKFLWQPPSNRAPPTLPPT